MGKGDDWTPASQRCFESRVTFLTILCGVSTRMTKRTSQEFSPQFCGRTRRLMQTCRFSRALEVQLWGGTEHRHLSTQPESW